MSTDKRTCGECKHFARFKGSMEHYGQCIYAPMPPWAYGEETSDTVKDDESNECECFERKDTK